MATLGQGDGLLKSSPGGDNLLKSKDGLLRSPADDLLCRCDTTPPQT